MLITALIIIAMFLIVQAVKLFHSAQNKIVTQEIKNNLSGAKLYMNETNVSTTQPVPLHGRVDQVFQLVNKRLLIMDTKVRDRIKIYPNDIVQLSVYAVILKNNGHDVCDFAAIRFVLPNGSEVYRRVSFIPERAIVTLFYRYWAIKNRDVKVECTCGKH